MIRISKRGITFDYNNDELTWFWWWVRTYLSGKYESLIYSTPNTCFNSLKDYWIYVGSKLDFEYTQVAKIAGFDYGTVITSWIKAKLRSGYYVVLYEINMAGKSPSFWRAVPDRLKQEMLKDVVVLKCKDETEALNICHSISSDFAYSICVTNGQVVHTTEDFRKPEIE
jgi:hypothetical protein